MSKVIFNDLANKQQTINDIIELYNIQGLAVNDLLTWLETKSTAVTVANVLENYVKNNYSVADNLSLEQHNEQLTNVVKNWINDSYNPMFDCFEEVVGQDVSEHYTDEFIEQLNHALYIDNNYAFAQDQLYKGYDMPSQQSLYMCHEVYSYLHDTQYNQVRAIVNGYDLHAVPYYLLQKWWAVPYSKNAQKQPFSGSSTLESILEDYYDFDDDFELGLYRYDSEIVAIINEYYELGNEQANNAMMEKINELIGYTVPQFAYKKYFEAVEYFSYTSPLHIAVQTQLHDLYNVPTRVSRQIVLDLVECGF